MCVNNLMGLRERKFDMLPHLFMENCIVIRVNRLHLRHPQIFTQWKMTQSFIFQHLVHIHYFLCHEKLIDIYFFDSHPNGLVPELYNKTRSIIVYHPNEIFATSVPFRFFTPLLRFFYFSLLVRG